MEPGIEREAFLDARFEIIHEPEVRPLDAQNSDQTNGNIFHDAHDNVLLVRLQVVSARPRRVFLEVIHHEEFVDLDDGLNPIAGTRTAFLHLKTPTGTAIRVEIPHENLDPLLTLLWPEDFRRE